MQLLLNFNQITSDVLNKYYDTIIQKTNEVNNEIINENGELKFSNTFGKLIKLDNELAIFKIFSFVSNFYPSDETRNTATELIEKYEKFCIGVEYNSQLYLKLNDYYTKLFQTEKHNLTNEEIKYVEDDMLSYKRNGIHLNNPEIETIRKRLTEITVKFDDNVNNYERNFEFTRKQLYGLPDSWFVESKLLRKGNTLDDDVYNVTLQYPDYHPIKEFTDSEEVRKQLHIEFNNKCSVENDSLFNECVYLKDKLAKLLGYTNYVEYSTEIKLIKNYKNVYNFLNDINDKFTTIFDNDINELTNFAKLYVKNPLVKPSLDQWDITYYSRLYKESQCGFDKQDLDNYFPLDIVINGTFNIYQTLLGLKFIKIDSENKWHSDVTLYQVNNSADNSLVGYFYLDLFPRQGKYGHAAAFDIYSGCELEDGTRRLPLSAMVCNFPKDACIDYDNVTTFFHEFGHIMHQTCSKTQLSRYTGFGVESDFVEVPSKMFEFWCTEYLPLSMMSKHIVTGQAISEDLTEKIKKYNKLLVGICIKRQLVYSMFDIVVHSTSYTNIPDSYEAWNEIETQIYKFRLPGTKFYTSFGHIIGGYDAGYYCYLLADAYSSHIYYKLFRNNLLNVEFGQKYRKIILEQGSTKNSNDLFEELMGEKLDNKYFMLLSS
jgi:Zn-dependent oligopeptidase